MAAGLILRDSPSISADSALTVERSSYTGTSAAVTVATEVSHKAYFLSDTAKVSPTTINDLLPIPSGWRPFTECFIHTKNSLLFLCLFPGYIMAQARLR